MRVMNVPFIHLSNTWCKILKAIWVGAALGWEGTLQEGCLGKLSEGHSLAVVGGWLGVQERGPCQQLCTVLVPGFYRAHWRAESAIPQGHDPSSSSSSLKFPYAEWLRKGTQAPKGHPHEMWPCGWQSFDLAAFHWTLHLLLTAPCLVGMVWATVRWSSIRLLSRWALGCQLSPRGPPVSIIFNDFF